MYTENRPTISASGSREAFKLLNDNPQARRDVVDAMVLATERLKDAPKCDETHGALLYLEAALDGAVEGNGLVNTAMRAARQGAIENAQQTDTIASLRGNVKSLDALLKNKAAAVTTMRLANADLTVDAERQRKRAVLAEDRLRRTRIMVLVCTSVLLGLHLWSMFA